MTETFPIWGIGDRLFLLINSDQVKQALGSGTGRLRSRNAPGSRPLGRGMPWPNILILSPLGLIVAGFIAAALAR